VAPIIDEFYVPHAVEEHMLSKHSVTVEEALEAAESTARHYRTYAGRVGERRYLLPGKTAAGRRVWVVFVHEPDRRGRVITAFEPGGDKERSRHERMRGI